MANASCFSQSELVKLSGVHAWPCVSVYFSLGSGGSWSTHGPTRLRGALEKVTSRLEDLNQNSKQIQGITGPAHELIDDSEFWELQDKGLALFLSSGLLHSYRLERQVQDFSHIAERFSVLPLLPLLAHDGFFYILLLSEHEIRLFEATRHTIDEVIVEGMPRTCSPQGVENEAAGQGSRDHLNGSVMFLDSGVGAEMDDQAIEITQSYERLDASLAWTLKNFPGPLLLAGPEELLSLYRGVNKSADILDEEVHGCLDDASLPEIQRLGWQAVKSHFLGDEFAAKAQFHSLLASGSGSEDRSTIERAALSGRVLSLFVALSDSEPEHEEMALCNRAALETLARGGAVFALAQEEMPTGARMAASFRC